MLEGAGQVWTKEPSGRLKSLQLQNSHGGSHQADMVTSAASHFKLAFRTIREPVLSSGSGMSSDTFLLFMGLEGAGLREEGL